MVKAADILKNARKYGADYYTDTAPKSASQILQEGRVKKYRDELSSIDIKSLYDYADFGLSEEKKNEYNTTVTKYRTALDNLKKYDTSITDENYNNAIKSLDQLKGKFDLLSSFATEDDYNKAVKEVQDYNELLENVKSDKEVLALIRKLKSGNPLTLTNEEKRKIDDAYYRYIETKGAAYTNLNATPSEREAAKEQIKKAEESRPATLDFDTPSNRVNLKLQIDKLEKTIESRAGTKYAKEMLVFTEPDFAEYEAKGKKETDYYDTGVLSDEQQEYLNKSERAAYYYYYGKYGRESAERYFSGLKDTLKRRAAGEQVEALADYPLLSTLYGTGLSVVNGVTSIGKLFSDDPETTELEYIQQGLRENTKDWLRIPYFDIGVGQTLYDVSTTVGRMAPSVAVSYLTGNILSSLGVGAEIAGTIGAVSGNVVLGASAAGDSYQDLVDRGMDKGAARALGIVKGAWEGASEYYLGRIEGLASKKVSKKLFGEALENAGTGVSRALLEFFTTGAGGDALGEGLEEVIQSIGESVIEEVATTVYNNANNADFKSKGLESLSELAYEFTLGALTAAVMNAPKGASRIIKGVSQNNTNKKLYSLPEDQAALVDKAAEAGGINEETAQKYRKALSENKSLSGKQITNLLNAIDTPVIKQAVSSYLAELGETDNIDRVSAAIAKTATWQELSELEAEALKNSKYGERVVSELNINNIASGQYSNALINELRGKLSKRFMMFDVANEISKFKTVLKGTDEETAEDNNGDDLFDEVKVDEGGGAFAEPGKREIYEGEEYSPIGESKNIIQGHIEKTARRLNPDLKIKWDPSVKTNGKWNPRTNTITLNPNISAAEGYVVLFKHEFMHSLESRADYKSFLQYCESKSVAFAQYAKSILSREGIAYTGGNKGAVQALFDYYYEIYTTDERIKPIDRQSFTRENAKQEAVADFFADVLFMGKEYRADVAAALDSESEIPEGNAKTSLTALKELAQKDKGLFGKLIDMVKRFISNLKSHNTNASVVRDLQKLESKLRDVYNSTQVEAKENTAGSGVKYKINLDTDIEEKNIDNGSKCLDSMMKQAKTANNPESLVKRNAMFRSEIGQVDFVWGKPGSGPKFKGGYGFSHIIAKHGESTARKAIETIAKATECSIQGNDNTDATQYRLRVYFDGCTAILSKSPETNHWLLTAWDNKEETAVYATGEVRDSLGATAVTPTLNRRSGVDTTVSNHSIRQNAEKSQEDFSDNEKSSLRGGRLDELRYRPEMFAKWLLRKNGSKADVATVTEMIKKIIAADNKGGKTWDINSEGEYTKVSTVEEPIEKLAKYIAEGAKLELIDDAKEIRRMIRTAKVYLDQVQIDEIKNKYRTLGEYRKSSGLNFSAGADISLDSMWQEWAAEYPNVFDPDMNPADMPLEIARIMSQTESMKEMYDYDGAAEYIAGQIREVIENSGPKAQHRREAIAANTAAKEATEKERARGKEELDEYKKKVEERKEKDAAAKRKREYRDKAMKLRDKFTKALENPKKNNHVPQQFIKAVVNALDIVYDNPIDYDDAKIGGKYYARLEKLNQDIQNTTDEQTRAELKEQYDRLYKTATTAGDKVETIKKMLEALGSEDTYAKTYNDPGDDKLFQVRKDIFNDSIAEMLGTLADELGETEAYNYTEKQFRMIYEVFSALDKHIADYNKLIGINERIEVSEAAEKLIDEVKQSHGNFKVLTGAILKQMSPLRLFRMLGNYASGSVSERIYEELNAGENKKIGYVMKAEEMLKREILGNKKLLNETRKMFSTNREDLVDSGLVDSNGNPVMVTRGMRLSLAMHGLNEQNRKALKDGGAEVPADLKSYYKKGAAASKNDILKAKIPANSDALQWYSRLNASLSEIEKKWIGVFQKYYTDISAPALNEVTMQVFGFKKATVKNYWRITRTDHFLDKPVDTVVRDSLLEHAGYLEKRKNSGKPIYLMDAIDQLTNDIENHSRYYGLVIPLSNFSKIYNFAQYDFDNKEWSGSVKETIDGKYSGGKVTEYIEDLIADLNGARRREVGILDIMRGRYAQAILSLNPRVAVKQTASYPTAAAVLGWKPIIKALAVVEKESGDKRFVFARAELNEIKKWSPLLWYRMRGNMDAELGSLKEGGNVGDKLAKKMPALLGWIEKMDAGTVGRLWYASKYYVEDNFKLEKGSPQFYKKTAEIFEKVIEETQPNYSTMQRPDVLRSTNALTRALTMFYTQRLQNANILFDSFMEFGTKKKALKSAKGSAKATAEAEFKEAAGKLGRAVSSQVVAAAMLNVMELVIRAAISQMKPYRDDETDEVTAAGIWQGLGNGMLDTMFGTVLFGSEIYEAVNAAIGNGKYYGMQVPAVETVNDIVNAFINDGKFVTKTIEEYKKGKLKKDQFSEKLTARILDNLTGVVQPFTGIPIKNAKDLVAGLVHQATDAINGELFSYEAEVENNSLNRIVGAKARSNAQSYRILAEAILNDDDEKYQQAVEHLIKAGASESSIQSGLKSALKDSKAVRAESEKLISEVESSKTYKELSEAGKDDVDSSTRDIVAKEKILAAGKDRSAKFSKLYDYRRNKDTQGYNRLKAELKAEGLTDYDIDIGEEIAKFRFLDSQGISVSEWFTAKKSLSEQNARKKAEINTAIGGMDFDSETKAALKKNIS